VEAAPFGVWLGLFAGCRGLGGRTVGLGFGCPVEAGISLLASYFSGSNVDLGCFTGGLGRVGGSGLNFLSVALDAEVDGALVVVFTGAASLFVVSAVLGVTSTFAFEAAGIGGRVPFGGGGRSCFWGSAGLTRTDNGSTLTGLTLLGIGPVGTGRASGWAVCFCAGSGGLIKDLL